MQDARRIARELALLSISQLPSKRMEDASLPNLITWAVDTLTLEIKEAIELASSELQKGSDRLFASDLKPDDSKEGKLMIRESIDLSQSAINRIGLCLSLPQFVIQANQEQVQNYTLKILTTINNYRESIDQLLSEVLVDWQLKRLVRIDQDILRLAVAEMKYLNLAQKVAINEAVELAKKYSDHEGYRFINGVLRRVSDKLFPKS